VRGRVLVAPYHAGSESLLRLRRLFIGGREFEVARAEQANLGFIVALRGVESRDQADELRGKEVEALRSELPPPGANEIYAVDLVGYEVVDAQGRPRGAVEELEEAGPQDLLRLSGGALVPMGLVREVQEEARRIIIDAPEGLFELTEERAPPATGGARSAQHPKEK
jgi:16S rRNA processing protein RimM